MEQHKDQLVAQIRRNAFRSRSARAALKMFAIAETVQDMNLANGERVLVHVAAMAPRPGDTPQLRRLRRKKRYIDVARPLNRHPKILEQLGELMPRFRGRPGARLREDLHMADDELDALPAAIENAFGCIIDSRAAADWETLNDVTDTIAIAMSEGAS